MIRNLFVFVFFLFFSCTNPAKNADVVDFADTLAVKHDIDGKGNKTVYIAIASMTSPKETYSYYSDMIKYISEKVGHNIFIKQKKTYEEVNQLLENGEVDFAFICSGAFVDEYKKKKIKLLVAPEIDNKLSYQSYIITHKGSGIKKFGDFKNKSFAFTDPLSNTGRLYPLKKLHELHTTSEKFFLKTLYTYGHDISIQMVNRGFIDGAAVHSLIYKYIAFYHPERVENIQIIEQSEEFGMPPVVVPVSLNDECFKKYQKIFLNMHKDSISKEMLKKLHINKFVVVHDSLYKSVFMLKKIIDDDVKE